MRSPIFDIPIISGSLCATSETAPIETELALKVPFTVIPELKTMENANNFLILLKLSGNKSNQWSEDFSLQKKLLLFV